MGWISRIAKSADLASGMMDRIGSDFPEAVMQNPETATRAYAGVVFRCAGCTDQEACARLQQENAQLDHPPAYCRNTAILERKHLA